MTEICLVYGYSKEIEDHNFVEYRQRYPRGGALYTRYIIQSGICGSSDYTEMWVGIVISNQVGSSGEVGCHVANLKNMTDLMLNGNLSWEAALDIKESAKHCGIDVNIDEDPKLLICISN